jgi:HAD superfamily hydrolase (TIGR01456 family)
MNKLSVIVDVDGVIIQQKEKL